MKVTTGKSGKRVVTLENLTEYITGALIEVDKRGNMPKDTLYVFPSRCGDKYHMHKVPFDLDIVFLDINHKVLKTATMVSEDGGAVAPKDTWFAVEAERGFFDNVKIGDTFIP